MTMFDEFYNDRSVLVTGHTGFKGSWLTEWLLLLGARVSGFSLNPPSDPYLFGQLGLGERMTHQRGDIRDLGALEKAVTAARPDVVFHLAAQPIVRRSYADPVETYSTNVMGTVHLLQVLRELDKDCAAVFVTSDKCYENQEWEYSYRESDPMGGHDPYSSSKGCTELAIHSFRRSFFPEAKSPIRIASARAGNVIGGGDWAIDRLVPDCIRALAAGQAIGVRNPHATRPWQHVLEALSGYLLLGERLDRAKDEMAAVVDSAYNFGPNTDSNRTNRVLVEEVLKNWPGTWEDQSDPRAAHEATLLHLSIDKAWHHLKWRPNWGFQTAVEETVRWYRRFFESSGSHEVMAELTRQQILEYVEKARRRRLEWAA